MMTREEQEKLRVEVLEPAAKMEADLIAANAQLKTMGDDLAALRKENAMLRADREQAIAAGVKEATKQIHDEAREFYRVEKRGAEKERDRSEKALGEALERMDRLERNHAKIRERNNELKAMLEEREG